MGRANNNEDKSSSVSTKGVPTLIEIGLPAPVQQRPRFEPPGHRNTLRVRWAKIKRRIGTGSLPTESLNEATTAESDSTSLRMVSINNQHAFGADTKTDDEEVDEVVVDNGAAHALWGPGSELSDKGDGQTGTSPGHTDNRGRTNERTSTAGSLRNNTMFEHQGPMARFYGFWRWRVLAGVQHFFSPTYHSPEAEEAYQKEQWYTSKTTAVWSGAFFVLNWVLAISLLPHPWSRWNKIVNYGLGPLTCLPLVPLIAFDVPRKHPWIWQLILGPAIWLWPIGNIIDMSLCNYYVAALRNCQNRDFMGTLYYAAALPVLAVFALHMKRAVAAVWVATYTIIVLSLIIPVRASYIRNVVNVVVFQGFVLFIAFKRDLSERRMYTLRAELKVQFKGKQKAQIAERKAADSKRRLTQYVFHEIRVPLNTALLAVQNLEGSNAFDNAADEHEVEFTALGGSLAMMSQVLNDVLDFSRMERGGFVSVWRPFSFHNVMRSICVPLQLDAAARGLTFSSNFDLQIDVVARRAAFPEEDDREIGEGEGIVLGDEMRLRQVVNNLCSNACKFTAKGGSVSIRTTLIYPTAENPLVSPDPDQLKRPAGRRNSSELTNDESSKSGGRVSGGESGHGSTTPNLSAKKLRQHDAKMSTANEPNLVARIEVIDTGAGIRARDLLDGRLFSAYVQTEIGRSQGGKGTGLGLALVRQIVTLSGGRLGVKSKWGEGSTFWCEIPLGIGAKTLEGPGGLSRPAVVPPVPQDKPGSLASGGTSEEVAFVPTLGATSQASLNPIVESGSPLSTSSRDSSVPDMAGRRLSIAPMLPPSFPLSNMGRPGSSGGRPGSSGSAHLAPQPLRPAKPEHSMSSASAPPMSTPPTAAVDPSQLPPMHDSEGVDPSAAIVGSGPMRLRDGPLRVLVVDDDALTRKLMTRMMLRLGCQVESAENGEIALRMIMEDRPDLQPPPGSTQPRRNNFDTIFLDNQMPVCSGIQAVKRLRNRGRTDLVVGVTANAMLMDQEEYLDAGASFVLTKPVLETDLRRMLIIANRRRANVLAGVADAEDDEPDQRAIAAGILRRGSDLDDVPDDDEPFAEVY